MRPRLLIYPKGADYKTSQEMKDYYVYYPQQITLSTTRECTPSSLTGNIPDVGGLFPEMGSRVMFMAEDGACVFSGNLFKSEVDRWGNVSFTAYDRLRYLRGDYTGNCYGWTVSNVVKDVLNTYAMPCYVEDVNIKVLKEIFKAQAGLDVISRMIDFAEVQSAKIKEAMKEADKGNGDIFVFFDDPYKGICFMKAENVFDLVMQKHENKDVLIGENNLATEFTLSVSIDDLFNSVKIYRQADDYGGYIATLCEDEESIDKFGPLRYYEQVDDPNTANKQQVELRAKLLLAMKNHVMRGFRMTALGVPGIRAGMFINISFPSYEKILGTISKTQRAFVSECSHTWENDTHTMDLTLNVATFELPPNTRNYKLTTVQR